MRVLTRGQNLHVSSAYINNQHVHDKFFDTGAIQSMTWRVSFHNRITGWDRLFSYPRTLTLAVFNMKNLPTAGSSPSQRAANTLRKNPPEKTNATPFIPRTRLPNRSAPQPTRSSTSPSGQPV